ncbi:MAG: hypothetical protein ACXVQQ_03505 [Gaiellaceae bacterium]
MTLTTLITLDIVLAAVVVYALVHFLTHGIRHDRRTHQQHTARVTSLPEASRDRIAA